MTIKILSGCGRFFILRPRKVFELHRPAHRSRPGLFEVTWRFSRDQGESLPGRSEGCEPTDVRSLLIAANEMNGGRRNEQNRRWLREINSEGPIMMTGTTLNGQFILRICVLSFRTHIDRLQRTIRIITAAAKRVLAEAKMS